MMTNRQREIAELEELEGRISVLEEIINDLIQQIHEKIFEKQASQPIRKHK